MQIIGHQIVRLKAVDSTNNYAANLLKATNPPEGTVIMAHEQYGGRGQRGATWQSTPGANITLSVILYPTRIEVSRQGLLNKAVAVAVCELVRRYTPDVRIKWPNDILCGDKKISGILVENSVQGKFLQCSVIGIGLNVNQVLFNDLSRATSLRSLTGTDHSVEQVAAQLFETLNVWYSKIQQDRRAEIEQAYMERLFKYREWATLQLNTGITEAMVHDVDDEGKLILMLRNGEMLRCENKEVVWLYDN